MSDQTYKLLLTFPIKKGDPEEDYAEIWSDRNTVNRQVRIFKAGPTWFGVVSQLTWDTAMEKGKGASLLAIVGKLIRHHMEERDTDG